MTISQSHATGRHYRVAAPPRGSVLGQAEIDALTAVLEDGASLSAASRREEFEAELAALVGCRHALTVTSGTVALEIAIRLLDLQAGDEVVVTPQTFQATAQPLLDSPATVRFCDVDPVTLNLDPDVLAGLLTERTRAVILVHYGGRPAAMPAITALAHAHGALVVEDCAHALGASTPEGAPGSLGDIGCFSFHSSKNITTLGEGGLITLHDDALAHRVRRIRDNRIDIRLSETDRSAPFTELRPWLIYADELDNGVSEIRRSGTNATLSEAACAVGLAQLERLPRMIARRAAIVDRLDAVVADVPGFTVQGPTPGVRSAHHLYTAFCELGAPARHQVLTDLDHAGVQVQLRYAPLHLTPEWQLRGHRRGECPVAERDWDERHLNLPCQPTLTDDQVDVLATELDRALRAASSRYA
ncbi:UDP-4-amino-4,6-dideoxy-N-acetyl-beta-L-altrosami ne transaminase [Isoptericola halotolerans]|uniref:Perosamine synthetase n=1 Tax=Isoptericola halotolerans TaxID=300560 RepID=A0ABX2A7C3_9MICO|nr:DegT/DnrJ/EryC1/StrS family aminotransferase [Isoptericola halotolerans]NOV98689.1 perosamine synthetase [Isoptericola halotolerans]